MKTLIENLYVCKNGNGTIDTTQGPSIAQGLPAMMTIATFAGGLDEVVKISVLTDLELNADELTFDYAQSMN